ncbi:MAG: NADH-quinone oxidoreductase subunit N, partial [Actinomycetota bacterium]
MTNLTMPSISYWALSPILFMLLGGVLLMAVAALSRRALPSMVSTGITFVAGTGALVFSLIEWNHVTSSKATTTVAGAIAVDGLSAVIAVTISCSVLLATCFGHQYLERMRIASAEYHVLALTSASGAMIMAAANDLVVLFLGLEILSIALYVLVALNRRSSKSEEAALKYSILGGFSSAIFVFGIAFTYGATGSTNLQVIAHNLAASVAAKPGILMIGLALLLVGFCFKVAAVPFHLWTPDVYEGAPTPVTGFMAAVAKTGGFAALIRVLLAGLPTARSSWTPVLYAIAIATLFGGALLMVVQRDLKRMLAYSS